MSDQAMALVLTLVLLAFMLAWVPLLDLIGRLIERRRHDARSPRPKVKETLNQ
jgi:hypothetical protein